MGIDTPLKLNQFQPSLIELDVKGVQRSILLKKFVIFWDNYIEI